MVQGAAHAAGGSLQRPMGFLILAHHGDCTAIRVARLLRERHGAAQVALRAVDEIVLAPHWEHRVTDAGTNTDIRMHDGVSLARLKPWVIFNRLSFVDAPQFAAAAPADREYARTELFALVLSWLADPGCPVINAPSPTGLAGGAHRLAVWHRLAARAGLATLKLTATSSTRRFPPAPGSRLRPDVSSLTQQDAGRRRPNDFCWFSQAVAGNDIASAYVIGDRVLPTVPEHLTEPCRRLARLAGVEVLRIDFARLPASADAWMFAGADPMPRVTDATGSAALVELIEARASHRAVVLH